MTLRERRIAEALCIDCGAPREGKTLRCAVCGEKNCARSRVATPMLRHKPLLGPAMRFPFQKMGIAEAIEFRADVMAGEVSSAVLAERYGVNPRFVTRARAQLRAQGVRVNRLVEDVA